jgi:hypothetical protein
MCQNSSTTRVQTAVFRDTVVDFGFIVRVFMGDLFYLQHVPKIPVAAYSRSRQYLQTN